MDDPFFSAASDLDKILDEFEETEAAKPHHVGSAPKSSSLNQNGNTTAHVKQTSTSSASDLMVTGDFPVMSDKNSTGQGGDDRAQFHLAEQSCKNDLLIDFSSPDIIPPVVHDVKTSDSTLKELDFLLSVSHIPEGIKVVPSTDDKTILPTIGKTQTDAVVSGQATMSEQNVNDSLHQYTSVTTQNNLIASVGDHNQVVQHSAVEEVEKIDILQSNLAPGLLDTVSDNSVSPDVVGFSHNLDVDDDEFKQFMSQDEDTTLLSYGSQLNHQCSDTGEENLNVPTSLSSGAFDGLELVDERTSTSALSRNNGQQDVFEAASNSSIKPADCGKELATPKSLIHESPIKPSTVLASETSDLLTNDEQIAPSALNTVTSNQTTPISVEHTASIQSPSDSNFISPGTAVQTLDEDHSMSSNLHTENADFVHSNVNADFLETSDQRSSVGGMLNEEEPSEHVIPDRGLVIDSEEDHHAIEYPGVAPPPYSSVCGDGGHASFQPLTNTASMEYNHNATLAQTYAFFPNENYQHRSETTAHQLPQHQGEVATPSQAISPVQVRRLGRHKPRWVPDENSPVCTNCGQKFTFTKRRHHCRACGRVFCSACCSSKSKLEYLNFAEARVCISCYTAILQADAIASAAANASNQDVPSTSSQASPEPSSHSESLPRPVLRNSEDSPSNLAKHVRFSDGTKPDHPSTLPDTPPMPSRMPRSSRARPRSTGFEMNGSTLPPLIVDYDETGLLTVEEYPDADVILTMLRTSGSSPIRFALSSNLFVFVRQVQYGSALYHYFVSCGLDSVGQVEVALLLEADATSDKTVFIQVFTLYTHLFTNARKGKAVHALDFILFSDVFGTEERVLGSDNNVGMLFVRRTCQEIDCLTNSGDANFIFDSTTVQYSSTLFVLLVHQQEKPWATLFPSRLLLGLAAQSKQYPYPLLNEYNRQPVYVEVSNTILAILCDFRNFKYRVVSVPGLSVVIKETGVDITIPGNRFTEIVKILNSSNEHVLAFGSDAFSAENACQSHLVCIQDSKTLSYDTSVLQNTSAEATSNENNTAASFIVFNGSLKSGSPHQAKCTIVEDGVMIQLLPEKMAVLKDSLKAMDDFRISCMRPDATSPTKLPPSSQQQDTANKAPATTPQSCQSVEIKWLGDDTKFNIGLSSPIDFQSFEGVVGYNVQGKSEKKGKHQLLRWNQVFFFKSTGDVLDMSRLSEQMADGCFQALVPHMKLLRKSNQTKLGIRVCIHSDDVGYKVGSRGLPLPEACLNALDEHLVFLLHDASAHLQPEDEGVEFELIFCVLEMRSNWKMAQ